MIKVFVYLVKIQKQNKHSFLIFFFLFTLYNTKITKEKKFNNNSMFDTFYYYVDDAIVVGNNMNYHSRLLLGHILKELDKLSYHVG